MVANCHFSSLQMFAGDSLPAQVCHQCIQQVNSSYNFKLQCESSDIALRQYLRNLDSQSNSYQVTDRRNYEFEVIIQDDLRVMLLYFTFPILCITVQLLEFKPMNVHNFIKFTSKSRFQQDIKAVSPSAVQMLCAVLISAIFLVSLTDR